MKLQIIFWLLISKLTFSQTNVEYPLVVDSILSKKSTENMYRGEYNAPYHNDIIKDSGTIRIVFYQDSAGSQLYKVMENKTLSASKEYLLLYYADNFLVKSESWILKKGKTVNYKISYYQGGKIIFSNMEIIKGDESNSYKYKADMYLMMLIPKSKRLNKS